MVTNYHLQSDMLSYQGDSINQKLFSVTNIQWLQTAMPVVWNGTIEATEHQYREHLYWVAGIQEVGNVLTLLFSLMLEHLLLLGQPT